MFFFYAEMGMEIMLKMTMNMTDDEETGTWCTVYNTEIFNENAV